MGRRKDVILFSRKYLGTLYNSAPIVADCIKSGKSIRDELSLREDDLLVLVVGRMTYDKGISFISDSISNCSLSNVKYLFIGEGPMLDYVHNKNAEEILNRKVFCLGKRVDILDIMARSDIFLFATLHENLSNALLEACVSGLAVICTNVGGNVEVIEDGVNGVLIPSSCTSSINNAITDLVMNTEKRNYYGKMARITVSDKFSQDKLLSKLNSVYSSML
jgi:glycosyltransferase involved in cell wall biosynthesis